MDDETLIRSAGLRALAWWLDTGECFFCAVDEGPPGHEEHCEFHGLTREQGIAIYTKAGGPR